MANHQLVDGRLCPSACSQFQYVAAPFPLFRIPSQRADSARLLHPAPSISIHHSGRRLRARPSLRRCRITVTQIGSSSFAVLCSPISYKHVSDVLRVKVGLGILLAVASPTFRPSIPALRRIRLRLFFAGLNCPPKSLRFVIPGFSAIQRRPPLRGVVCGRPSPVPGFFLFGRRAGHVLVQ